MRNEYETSLLTYWGIVDPDYQHKNLGGVSAVLTLRLLFENGWRCTYGILSNPISTQLTSAILGKVIME